MESTSLGGAVSQIARGAVGPACREGRVSKLNDLGDGRYTLEVAVRSIMGDTKTLPARGYAPHIIAGGGGPELLEAERGDPVWVMDDEGRQLVVVAWEPKA